VTRPIDWRRLAGGAALLVTLAILSADLGKLITAAVRAFGFPYDLDYGEGIVWQQMDNIAAGQGYGPLGTFPAIVYHYPPVYHLTVAAIAALSGLDALIAGRLVSLLSTFAAMAMVGWLSVAVQAKHDDRRAALAGGTLGGLLFGTSPTVLGWASLMRVDMLATALTLAGLCFTILEIRLPRRVPWAAFTFALAVYCKQTAVMAPAVAFVTLWVVRPASAWRFLLVCGSMGIAVLVVLMAMSHGGFLRHVVEYNVNRFDPARWWLLASTLATQAITVGVAVMVAFAAWQHWRLPAASTWRARCAASPWQGAMLLIVLYLGVRIATLPLVLKSGANDNYLIDLFSAAAILTGVAASAVASAVLTGEPWPRAFITLLVLIGIPLQAGRLGDAHAAASDPKLREQDAAIVERIRRSPRPVITDYMVMLRRAGKPVMYEPAIAAELTHSGLYDEAGFVRLIRRGTFGFFLTQGDRGDFPYYERYNPRVAEAIAQAYPRIERHGEMVLHLPADR
jgi:hypothetical protein